MPVDPMCGCDVDKSTPFKDDVDGVTYFFCSEDCMEEFDSTDDDLATKSDYPENLLER